MRLFELVLTNNIFKFSNETYKQDIGTSMGSHPAPPFANIVMAKIDKSVWKIAKQSNNTKNAKLMFLNRFLDDLFSVFQGSTKLLHELWNKMNKIHPSVQFTMQHTKPTYDKDQCDCPSLKSIPFLESLYNKKWKKYSGPL